MEGLGPTIFSNVLEKLYLKCGYFYWTHVYVNATVIQHLDMPQQVTAGSVLDVEAPRNSHS